MIDPVRGLQPVDHPHSAHRATLLRQSRHITMPKQSTSASTSSTSDTPRAIGRDPNDENCEFGMLSRHEPKKKCASELNRRHDGEQHSCN